MIFHMQDLFYGRNALGAMIRAFARFLHALSSLRHLVVLPVPRLRTGSVRRILTNVSVNANHEGRA
jgi:hypothetical protein